MRKLIFFIGLAGSIYSAPAQSMSPGSTHAPTPANHSSSGGLKAFLHDLTLELPQVEAKYSIPVRDKSLLKLPYGMDQFLYPAQSSFSPMVDNFTFRGFAVFYKDKIGLECYWNGFGSRIDMSGFNRYMAAQFPNYYLNANNAYNSFYFNGPAWGIAYRIHWQSFIVEPKFLFGLESKSDVVDNYSTTLKEKGSNQFIQYSIIPSESSSRQHSFNPRLLAGRRFHFKKTTPTEFECGFVGDFIYSPFSFRTEIRQQSYGSPPVSQFLDVRVTYRQFNVGLYCKIYLHQWIF